MIKLINLLFESNSKPKAIFMAGPAGSGKSFIADKIIPTGLNIINVDTTYEELLKSTNLGTKVSDFNQTQLSKAASLMAQARKAVKDKYSKLSTEKQNIVIDGTGSAIEPLLKKKQELEDLGYDTMMIMIWVSPYTSLERNAKRERSLQPGIILRTWRDVNSNIGKYQDEFKNNFILINNDDKKAEYDPEYVKRMYFDTVKGSGKVYTADERAERDKSIMGLNNAIENLVNLTPNFTDLNVAKNKIQNFLK